MGTLLTSSEVAPDRRIMALSGEPVLTSVRLKPSASIRTDMKMSTTRAIPPAPRAVVTLRESKLLRL